MPKKEDMISHILKEIHRTGYPLELQISSLLDSIRLRWLLDNNKYYYDAEERKGREIDIFAKRSIIALTDKEEVNPHLVIECKKSDSSAWIFFGRSLSFAKNMDGQCLDPEQINSNYKTSLVDEFTRTLNKSKIKLHYDAFENVAYSYTPVKLDKDSKFRKEQIFEAVVQVMKFTATYIQGTVERLGANSTAIPLVFFPIIVLDGSMYEYVLDGSKERVTKTNHLLVSSSYRPMGTLNELGFLIDIVTKDGIKPLLEMIESDIDQLNTYLKNLKQDKQGRRRQRLARKSEG